MSGAQPNRRSCQRVPWQASGAKLCRRVPLLLSFSKCCTWRRDEKSDLLSLTKKLVMHVTMEVQLQRERAKTDKIRREFHDGSCKERHAHDERFESRCGVASESMTRASSSPREIETGNMKERATRMQ